MIFDWVYRHYKDKFYDKLIEQFIGEVPDSVREPALDFLADRKVLFEKFLSIQAYHIQKARIQSKKSQDFYDGALMIIKAFLAAVNKQVALRPGVMQSINPEQIIKDELDGVNKFRDKALGIEPKK